jgi:hypothetical protein
MKAQRELGRVLLALAVTAVLLNYAKATEVFPIATNSSVVEFAGPIFFDGANGHFTSSTPTRQRQPLLSRRQA